MSIHPFPVMHLYALQQAPQEHKEVLYNMHTEIFKTEMNKAPLMPVATSKDLSLELSCCITDLCFHVQLYDVWLMKLKLVYVG